MLSILVIAVCISAMFICKRNYLTYSLAIVYVIFLSIKNYISLYVVPDYPFVDYLMIIPNILPLLIATIYIIKRRKKNV